MIRVRMAPSPTGSPHVGLVRTALFNWAFARANGGEFILRIDDTDPQRNTEQSYHDIVELFTWLGLHWDEGPKVGGGVGPYRQSERDHIYRQRLNDLLANNYAYECFCTAEEIDARNERNNRGKQGYDNFCRNLSATDRIGRRAAGRTSILRFRMPDHDIAFTDLVRGEVVTKASTFSDYALTRRDRTPLYTLVTPVDDNAMNITHVLRGEDLLSSTPRQIALHQALINMGYGGLVPSFGHLPYVMGEGNRKLAKRDAEANALMYRERGFLPEALLNYLALLGWSLAPDRDVFTLAEMVEAFDIKDVNANPARFDLKKAEALNAAHVRGLTPTEFYNLTLPLLETFHRRPLIASERNTLMRMAPLLTSRLRLLPEVIPMMQSLLVRESEFTVTDPEPLRDEFSQQVLGRCLEECVRVSPWTSNALEARLRRALIDDMGLKPRQAFSALRLATSGQRVSPPLFECLELLGRARTLARIRRAIDSH